MKHCIKFSNFLTEKKYVYRYLLEIENVECL